MSFREMKPGDVITFVNSICDAGEIVIIALRNTFEKHQSATIDYNDFLVMFDSAVTEYYGTTAQEATHEEEIKFRKEVLAHGTWLALQEKIVEPIDFDIVAGFATLKEGVTTFQLTEAALQKLTLDLTSKPA